MPDETGMHMPDIPHGGSDRSRDRDNRTGRFDVLISLGSALNALRIADALRRAHVCRTIRIVPIESLRPADMHNADTAFVCHRLLPGLLDASDGAEPARCKLIAIGPAGEHAWMQSALDYGASDCWPATACLADAAPSIVRRVLLRAQGKPGECPHDDLESDLIELRAELRKLEEEAATDPLTGLANRRQLDHRKREFWAEACRHNEPLSCLAIDLDHFKPINDALGHQRGDTILRIVAEILNRETRISDFCVRSGGDEFVVLMPRTSDHVARLVGARVAAAFCADDRVVQAGRDVARVRKRAIGSVWCTLSFGVATAISHDQASYDSLLARADEDLLAAKRARHTGASHANGSPEHGRAFRHTGTLRPHTGGADTDADPFRRDALRRAS